MGELSKIAATTVNSYNDIISHTSWHSCSRTFTVELPLVMYSPKELTLKRNINKYRCINRDRYVKAVLQDDGPSAYHYLAEFKVEKVFICLGVTLASSLVVPAER